MSATLETPRTSGPVTARHGAWPAWATAVTAALGFAGVYAVAVQTSAGQHVDDRLMSWAATTAGARAAWADSLLETVGSPPSLLLATAAVVGLALLVHGPRRAVAVAAATAGTVVAAQVLKAALERPTLTDELSHNSFPSGHVAAVAALAVALVLASPRALRPLLVLAGCMTVALVGLATTALEWHRPSDVVGSVLLAVAVGGLAAAVSARESGQPTD